ncbi:MlaC/ttg2D family ABC transporter substrate-binding protein [Aliikangiella sp. IMCC44359]|uniref:MlaC/ttg2D family ABC transporter substrate-binding protein n=1 Tax=Aliikangiella sp. IMCC44359 TaxID=3459125 RepID=UPI00403B2AEB
MRKLIGSLIILFWSFNCFAQAAKDPSEYLKGIADKMITAIESNKEALKTDSSLAQKLVTENLLPVIDKEEFARKTLGKKTWETLSDKQQEAFINGYINSVIEKYAKGISLYDGQAFVFEKAEFSKKTTSARVRSSMKQSGAEPLDINYYLSPDSGQWLITNIVVAGTDMRKSYKRQFLPRIKEVGIDAFIKELENTKSSE